jgi:GT2 family glycosyltransferase
MISTATVDQGQPRVLCCVINWNGVDDTIECLESVLRLDYPRYDVLLVDNGSVRDEAETVHRAFGDRVATMRLVTNEGFGGGANRGVHYAMERGYDYILLLNNDCTVATDLLSELVRAAGAYSNVAVVGPAVCYYGEPAMVNSLGSLFGKCMARSHRLGVGMQINAIPRGHYEVDFVDGSCMLVHAPAIAYAGELDPTFFLYWEEVDWCVRFRRHGYRILCSPSTRVWHKVSASVGGSASELYFYASLRNQLLFIRRNPRRFCLVPRCVAFAQNAVASILHMFVHRYREGPIGLFRIVWLTLCAIAWNVRDTAKDPILMGLIRLREQAILAPWYLTCP